MNKVITEMKKTPDGINSRITEAGEWISDLEDRMAEISALEQNKEKNNGKESGQSQTPLRQH